MLANALADRAGAIGEAPTPYVARLRPWVEAAERMARRNGSLFTPANRLELLASEAVLRLAARPFLAPVFRMLLDREGKRLSRRGGTGVRFPEARHVG